MRSSLGLIAALLFCGIAGAQPATTYDVATPSGTTSVTGFSYIVDLADLSAAWWSAAENVDATRGRVYDDNGSTQYASDWIDYDHTGNTGLVRFQVTATGAVPDVRVYPPVSGNATVAASATYGSDNAYDANWAGYWPSGGGVDRTANGNPGTAQGDTIVGDTTGPIGSATSVSGNDPSGVLVTISSVVDYPLTVLGLHYNHNTVLQSSVAAYGDSGSARNMMGHRYIDQGSQGYLYSETFNSFSGAAVTDDTWAHLGTVFASNTSRVIYTNGASSTDATDSDAFVSSPDMLSIGYFGDSTPTYTIGTLSQISIHSAARSADWIGVEYEHTNDNSTFWGGWTNVAAGGQTPGLPVIERLFVAWQD